MSEEISNNVPPESEITDRQVDTNNQLDPKAVEGLDNKGDSDEAITKQATELEAKNDITEKTLKQAKEGKETAEVMAPNERFKEILKDQLCMPMQMDLGINIYTDVTKFTQTEAIDAYETVQKSYRYVSSHTSESLGGAYKTQIMIASQKLNEEIKNSSAQNNQAVDQNAIDTITTDYTIESGDAVDMQTKVDSLKTVMLEMVQTVIDKLEALPDFDNPSSPGENSDRLYVGVENVGKSGIASAYEQMIINGKKAALVDSFPKEWETKTAADNDAKNTLQSMRLRLEAKGPKPVDGNEKDVQSYNALVEKFNDALKTATDVDKAQLVIKYGEAILASNGDIPSFEDFNKQPATEVATEEAPATPAEGVEAEEENTEAPTEVTPEEPEQPTPPASDTTIV